MYFPFGNYYQRPTHRTDRRIQLGGDSLVQRLGYLQQMLGIQLNLSKIDGLLTKIQLESARPSGYDPRSANALKIAREDWSLRDIPAHCVIDYYPVIVGLGVEAADHMQA